MISFTLPKPISTNKLYANAPGKGRVKTKAYKDWIKECGWLLKAKRPEPVHGPYHIKLQVSRKRNKDGSFSKNDIDLGNALKATEDVLQHYGVIENDKLSQSIVMEWTDGQEGMRVTLSEAA